MATNVLGALKLYDRKRHELSVWNAVINHLGTYLSQPGREPEDRISAEGCSRPHVPEDIIREISDLIVDEKVDTLTREIKRIENVIVPLEEPANEPEGKTAENQGKKQKGVRQIHRSTVRNRTKPVASVESGDPGDLQEPDGTREVDEPTG